MHSRSDILAHRLSRLGLPRRDLPPTESDWQEFVARLERYVLDQELPYANRRRDSSAARRIGGLDRVPERRESAGTRARNERDNLRAVVDALSDALCQIDRKMRIQFVNSAGEKLFGSSVRQLRDRNLFDIVWLYDGNAIPENLCDGQEIADLLLAGEELSCQDGTFKCWDGRAAPVQFVITPVQKDNELTGALLVVRDLTEEKMRERELAEARSDADDARRAQEAKSEFLANMSHEIRTPMNGVVGMLDLLIDGELDALQRDYAATARSSANALLSLINDILDFSKIEAGKYELEEIDYAVRDHLEGIAMLLAAGAQEKSVELIVDIDPALPHALVGDPARLRQILTNLAGNAVKFTETGYVRLSARLISAGRRNDPVVVRYEIEDTGIGIPDSARAKLFDSFSQVDASTTRRFGGTGLGLAICKLLADLMGASLDYTSETGVGTTFHFEVTLQRSNKRPTHDTANVAMVSGRRVLVVDDVAPVRDQLRRRLTSWGLAADEAHDARSALAKIDAAIDDRRPYDLILVDKTLPGVDGVDLLWSIRSDRRLQLTRIVLMSTVGDTTDAAQTKGARVSSYLTKPLRDAQLYAAIFNVLSGRRKRQLSIGWRKATAMMRTSSLPTTKRVDGVPNVLLVEPDSVERRAIMGRIRRRGYRVEGKQNAAEASVAMLSKRFDMLVINADMIAIPTGRRQSWTQLNCWIFGPDATEQSRVAISDGGAVDDLGQKLLGAGFHAVVDRPPAPQQIDWILDTLVPIDGEEAKVEREMREIGAETKPLVLSTLGGNGAGAPFGDIDETEDRPWVLVAEDNHVNQVVTRAMLKRLGYRCDVVNNGQQAIDALRTKRYAAVLMDCMMPVLDGMEAARRIRAAEPKGVRLPIIALTANAMRGDRARVLESGMDEYVSKPVDRETLGAALALHIARSEEQVQAAEAVQAEDLAAHNDELPAVDIESLAQLRAIADDDSFVTEVVGIFLADLPGRIESLEKAITDTDFGGIKRVAHHIKGASRYVGAAAIAHACKSLEIAADDGDLARVKQLREQLAEDSLCAQQTFKSMGVA